MPKAAKESTAKKARKTKAKKVKNERVGLLLSEAFRTSGFDGSLLPRPLRDDGGLEYRIQMLQRSRAEPTYSSAMRNELR